MGTTIDTRTAQSTNDVATIVLSRRPGTRHETRCGETALIGIVGARSIVEHRISTAVLLAAVASACTRLGHYGPVSVDTRRAWRLDFARYEIVRRMREWQSVRALESVGLDDLDGVDGFLTWLAHDTDWLDVHGAALDAHARSIVAAQLATNYPPTDVLDALVASGIDPQPTDAGEVDAPLDDNPPPSTTTTRTLTAAPAAPPRTARRGL